VYSFEYIGIELSFHSGGVQYGKWISVEQDMFAVDSGFSTGIIQDIYIGIVQALPSTCRITVKAAIDTVEWNSKT
jgi:hypothetical protein